MNEFLLDAETIKIFKNKYEQKAFIQHNFYNYEPKLKYNQTLHWMGIDNKVDNEDFYKSFKEHNKGFEESIGNYESYKKKVNPRLEDISKFDIESKIISPITRTKKNIEMKTYYSSPHSNDKLKGMFAEPPKCSNHKSKSLGQTNPVEHYFAYMSDEKQQPNHIVLPFPRGGYDTRHLNKLYKNL